MNPEWRTPRALFDKIDAVFHFDLDVAATAENALCERYYTKESDALTKCWGNGGYSVAWMNPPYSKGEMERWTYQAASEAPCGCTTVGLVRSDHSTEWWWRYVLRAACIVNLCPGRVKFDGPQAGTPTFSSSLVIWTPEEPLRKPEVEWWNWREEPLTSFAAIIGERYGRKRALAWDGAEGAAG